MIPERTPGSQWVRNLRVYCLLLIIIFGFFLLLASPSYPHHCIGPLFPRFFLTSVLLPGSLKGAADEAIKKFEKESAEKVTKQLKIFCLKSLIYLSKGEGQETNW